MKIIVMRELKNYLKNPVLWIGLVLIMFGLFLILRPYLQIHYFASEQELAALETLGPESLGDADIMDGYVPSTKEQQMNLALEMVRQELTEAIGLSDEETLKLTESIQGQNLSVWEMSDVIWTYVFDNYGYSPDSGQIHGLTYWHGLFELHKGNAEEVNQYIIEKLSAHSYSWYFSRKYADFCGLFLGFFSAILLAFLFIADTRKDIYELLHTKPVSAKSYIIGKAGGGFLAMTAVWGLLTLCFGVLCQIYGTKSGFPVNIGDFLLTSIIYVLPNILMLTCIYTATALLFKTPLPAVPGIVLYMIYSNMGSLNEEGIYGYYGRPLAIMVRFPGRFFETAPPPMAAQNQIFLLIASAVMLIVAAMLWKRRRVY